MFTCAIIDAAFLTSRWLQRTKPDTDPALSITADGVRTEAHMVFPNLPQPKRVLILNRVVAYEYVVIDIAALYTNRIFTYEPLELW